MSTRAGIIRPLGRLERAMAATSRISPFNVAAAVRYRGRVSAGELVAAAHRVVRANPVLGRTLTEDLSAWTQADGEPQVAESDADERKLIEEGLCHRFAPGAPLWWGQAGQRDDADGVTLVVVCSHLLMDGVSLLALFHAIGNEHARGTHDAFLPPLAFEDRWPNRTVGAIVAALAGAAGQEWRYRRWKRHDAGTHDRDEARVVTYSLANDVAAAVARAARRRRLTLHSVIQAAHMLAVGEHFDERDCLRGMAFADLRGKLDPPAAPTELGAALAMMPYLVPSSGRLEDVASDIQASVVRQQRDGTHYGRNWLSPLMMKMIDRRQLRMADVALSWSGRLPGWSGGDVRIDRTRAFISPTRVGPLWGVWGHRDAAGVHFDAAYPASALSGDVAESIARSAVLRLKSLPDR